MRPKEPAEHVEKPLLLVDIDGVISLFGFAGPPPWRHARSDLDEARTRRSLALGDAGQIQTPAGSLHVIDGIPHFLSHTASALLLDLAGDYELVWASGWEEKAEEHLPRLLGLPADLPYLRFERAPGAGNAHWKLAAIESYAGARPLAWIDDSFNDACHAWARERPAPTLLVQTTPERGLTATEAQLLSEWARKPPHERRATTHPEEPAPAWTVASRSRR